MHELGIEAEFWPGEASPAILQMERLGESGRPFPRWRGGTV
jgi:hypothetical protein